MALAFAVVMAGTTLPSPLYPLYQQHYGFGSLTTTIIYAVYAAGVMVALILFGTAADRIGRRPVLTAAVLLSAASAALFVTDAAFGLLFAGRVLSGLSAGLVTAAATAAMIEHATPEQRTRATVAASAVNMLGLGCGPLLAGLLAQFAPWPLHLTYAVHLALLVPALVIVLATPETVRSPARWRTALRSQRPGVDPQTRPVFVPAAVAVFAAFAVFGLLTAIEPGLLAQILHRRSHAVAGAVSFSVFGGSAVGQLLSRNWTFRRALPAGCLILVLGLAGVAAGLLARSLPLLAAGTVVVGIGQGVVFRSGIAAVTAASPEQRRGETVSAYMVVAYIAISVPVVAVGLLVVAIGLKTAALVFLIAVALLALAAAGIVRRAERNRVENPLYRRQP